MSGSGLVSVCRCHRWCSFFSVRKVRGGYWNLSDCCLFALKLHALRENLYFRCEAANALPSVSTKLPESRKLTILSCSCLPIHSGFHRLSAVVRSFCKVQSLLPAASHLPPHSSGFAALPPRWYFLGGNCTGSMGLQSAAAVLLVAGGSLSPGASEPLLRCWWLWGLWWWEWGLSWWNVFG